MKRLKCISHRKCYYSDSRLVAAWQVSKVNWTQQVKWRLKIIFRKWTLKNGGLFLLSLHTRAKIYKAWTSELVQGHGVYCRWVLKLIFLSENDFLSRTQNLFCHFSCFLIFYPRCRQNIAKTAISQPPPKAACCFKLYIQLLRASLSFPSPSHSVPFGCCCCFCCVCERQQKNLLPNIK